MDERARYRTIRNVLGLVLAAIWLIQQWGVVSAKKAAALAQLGSCDGVFRGAKCWFDKGNIDANMGGEFFLALLLSPLAWVVAHYVAKGLVWMQVRAAEAQAEREDRALAHEERQRSNARLEEAQSATAQAKDRLDRGEFIHKLGAVNDFLHLLEKERAASRKATIRLGATQALRDLVAKHPVEQLKAIVASDSAVATSLRATLTALGRSPLADIAEVQVLSSTLPETA